MSGPPRILRRTRERHNRQDLSKAARVLSYHVGETNAIRMRPGARGVWRFHRKRHPQGAPALES